MSAITFVNAIPASTAPAAEFRLLHDHDQVARLSVHAGGSASVPTTTEAAVGTVQTWTAYAIVNGITTPNQMVTNPNATITARGNDNDGFTLTIS